MKNILMFESQYSRETELYRKVLEVYSAMAGIGLTDKEIEVLIMYIRYGYNKETKEIIIKELKFKSSNYIHVMNFNLKKKGMLVDDKYQRTKKEISSTLKDIKEFIELKKEQKLLPLNFVFNVNN